MEVQQPTIGLTNAELAYYAVAQQFSESFGQEVCLVGVGLGGGFINTMELHPMKYEQAMASPGAAEWAKAVDKEHDRTVNAHVFKATPLSEVPDDATILTETWAMKKKSNGIFRARVTARGFEQIDGEHFDSSEIVAPVVSEITIHVVLILWIMVMLDATLQDVIAAFLLERLNPLHKMFMRVPRGFEKFPPPDVVLLLERTIYGTRQAVIAFWKELLHVMKDIKMKQSKADPCLYYKWTDDGLVLWKSWVDDLLGIGSKANVKK
jgi:Reverse transcriptase (RNA-dependent DNA polymerase)